ncbi:hypothetical protein CBR_g1138 [Chara braunii]|uniref:Uncharacterized protein n=1 Tax=Chara braunii TaxID=69332 RepID=A0A388KD77_CHABU|nr:hypothetical protein CBR_g1138 [Chara braunii]|eukprot:GBG68018.1 hypothetical protein CBR_g1138 [Chara braunii]
MSKLYNHKPWALDWVGGLHTSSYGAVVFLSDDNGGSWYCCGGVEKSEAGRANYDDRKFRTFFLTSVYDSEGKNWVKEDNKVFLDLRLFQGYGNKAFSMKAFDVRSDGTEFRMLDPEKFLSKTNGCRVTGSLPFVDSPFLLSGPLVQFNSLTDQPTGVVMRYREQFTKLPVAQQVDRAFALSAPVSPSHLQGQDAAEQSSEATDYDDGALRHRASPQHRSQGGARAFDEEECEGQEGEDGGEEDDGGNEGDVDGEDNDVDNDRYVGGEEVEDNRFYQCERRRDVNETQACRGDDAYGVSDANDADGQPATSHEVSQSYNQAKDGRDKHGSRGKRKRGEASISPMSQTKQARIDAVNEALLALTTAQETRAPRKTGGGGGELAVVAVAVTAVGKARRGSGHMNCGTRGMRARGWGLACPKVLTTQFSTPRPST